MSSAFGAETVLEVRHWTDAYFSFTTTRQRFPLRERPVRDDRPGNRGATAARYSIASANWEEQLEFFSIKVQDGPLTSRLQHQAGRQGTGRQKPTGTLLISDLHPGRNLYLLGTGTGLAPWLSVIRTRKPTSASRR